MAEACNCASLGLAFTAIALFFMLLGASGQAVPASVESSIASSYPTVDVKPLGAETSNTSLPNEWDCSSVSDRLCKYSADKIILKRMKHRNSARTNINTDNSSNEPSIKSSKNLHERQVRSLERSNKFTRSRLHSEKNSFASAEHTKTDYDFIGNISLDDRIHKIMNNGVVAMENIVSEATLATESDVKANVQKETSDKIHLHVNGELTAFCSS